GMWLERVLDEGLRAHAGEVFAGALLYALVAHDLALTPKHVTDMFVFNYERPYPDREADPRGVFTMLFYAAPAVALSPWLLDRAAQAWRFVRAFPTRAGRARLFAAWRERMDGAPLATEEPPQDRWLLVEQARLTVLRTALGPSVRLRVVESRNNKFALTVAERREQGQPAAAPVAGQNGAAQPAPVPAGHSGGTPSPAQPPPSTTFGAPP